uniref:Uncharacterized protein n=1 Tax=Anopheles melas TaxID=34690 RepID=A0A182TYG6_9DIPT
MGVRGEQMQPVPDRDWMAGLTPGDAGCTGCEERQSPSRGDESDGSAVGRYHTSTALTSRAINTTGTMGNTVVSEALRSACGFFIGQMPVCVGPKAGPQSLERGDQQFGTHRSVE